MTGFERRPLLALFDKKSALIKVRLAKNGWNTRDAVKGSLA